VTRKLREEENGTRSFFDKASHPPIHREDDYFFFTVILNRNL
jgi:hypothetical protein